MNVKFKMRSQKTLKWMVASFIAIFYIMMILVFYFTSNSILEKEKKLLFNRKINSEFSIVENQFKSLILLGNETLNNCGNNKKYLYLLREFLNAFFKGYVDFELNKRNYDFKIIFSSFDKKLTVYFDKNSIQNYFIKVYDIKLIIPTTRKGNSVQNNHCKIFSFLKNSFTYCILESKGKDNAFEKLFIVSLVLLGLSILIVMRGFRFIKHSYINPITELKEKIDQLSLGEMLNFDDVESGSAEVKDLIKSLKNYSLKIIELSEFKETIEEDATIEEVYERIKTLLIDKFGIKKFSIYRVKSGKDKIKPIFIEGKEKDTFWCSREIFIDSNMCRAKRTVKIVDSLVEFKNICPYFRGASHYHVCFPIITGETVGLILQIVYSEDEIERTRSLLPEIEKYIKEVAPVLESKILLRSLKETTMRDPLTGIYNRRFLEEFSEQLIANAQRSGYRYGVLMVDIDHFKKVNDRYGHDVGDFLLKELVKIFHNTIRRSDLAFRYGGEEFLIILSDVKTVENAEKVAEKIRVSVEKERFKTGSLSIEGVTISIGVSVYPIHSEDFWLSIKYADMALYKAKELGRNRVVVFSPEMAKEDE